MPIYYTCAFCNCRDFTGSAGRTLLYYVMRYARAREYTENIGNKRKIRCGKFAARFSSQLWVAPLARAIIITLLLRLLLSLSPSTLFSLYDFSGNRARAPLQCNMQRVCTLKFRCIRRVPRSAAAAAVDRPNFSVSIKFVFLPGITRGEEKAAAAAATGGIYTRARERGKVSSRFSRIRGRIV